MMTIEHCGCVVCCDCGAERGEDGPCPGVQAVSRSAGPDDAGRVETAPSTSDAQETATRPTAGHIGIADGPTPWASAAPMAGPPGLSLYGVGDFPPGGGEATGGRQDFPTPPRAGGPFTRGAGSGESDG